MEKLKLIVTFGCLFLLPQFFSVSMGLNSLSLGLTASAIIILVLNIDEVFNQKFTTKSALLCCFVVFLLLVDVCTSYLIGAKKPLFSLAPFLIVIYSSYILSKYFHKVNVSTITNGVLLMLFILIGLGWLKLAYKPTFLNYGNYHKAVFPFSEESHYALVVGMLAVTYTFLGKMKWMIVIFLNLLLLAVSYPNLTLLIFVSIILLAMSTRFNKVGFYICSLVVCPVCIFLALSVVMEIEYFASRMNLNSLENLTTVVFLQGWQLAHLNFLSTTGLGLGFQMLGGATTVVGDYTFYVLRFTPDRTQAVNLTDGGFLAAKLIAEFGIIGLLITIYYIISSLRAIFKINYLNNLKIDDPQKYKLIFMYGIIFAFFVEVMLRGYGYFSPGFLLVITAFFYLKNNKVKL